MSVDEMKYQRKQAERLVAQKRYEEAAELYRLLLVQDDTHAKAWYGIGYCYYKLGHLDQSRLSMREARRRGYVPADSILERIRVRIGRGEGQAVNTPAPIVTTTPIPEATPQFRRPSAARANPEAVPENPRAVLAQAVRRLSERREALRKQLERACQEVGDMAAASEAYSKLPQWVSVQDARRAVSAAETDRIKAARDERVMRERYQQEKEAHLERADRLRSAYDPLESELKTLRERIQAVDQEIAAARAGISAAMHAGTSISNRKDSPITRFREAKEGADRSRNVLTERLEEVKNAAHVHLDKIRQEEAVWRLDRERLIREIDAATAAGESAANKAGEAARIYSVMACELGRVLAGADGMHEGWDDSLSLIRRLQKELAACDSELNEKRHLLESGFGPGTK